VNDKEILTDDANNTPEVSAAVDETPPKTASEQDNQSTPNTEIASDNESIAEAKPKPKRKYTRKTAAKQNKPKTQTETEAADTEENLPCKEDSLEIKKDEAIIPTKEDAPITDEGQDNAESLEIAEDAPVLDLYVEEEFKFIPDLTSPIFEEFLDAENESENQNTEDADEEEEEQRILPPDELFADRRPITEESQESAPSPEQAYEEETADVSIDDDGQYRFAELDKEDEEETPPIATEPEAEKYDPKKPRRIDGRFDILELFVFTLLAVMIITSFFFRHSVVVGVSMEQTLYEGDHLIISDLFYKPKQGDIIVCEDYTTAERNPIVKRVIAVEGDFVEIKQEGVFVNGKLLEEDYVYIDTSNYNYSNLTLKVPEGELFVMGDHRNKSTDSRLLGTISEDSVLGRVLIRFYPFAKFGTVK